MPTNREEMQVDLDGLTAMARRIGLKGGDLTQYVHEHMTKLGYKSKRSYYRADDKGNGERSAFSFFGGSRDSSDEEE